MNINKAFVNLISLNICLIYINFLQGEGLTAEEAQSAVDNIEEAIKDKNIKTIITKVKYQLISTLIQFIIIDYQPHFITKKPLKNQSSN